MVGEADPGFGPLLSDLEWIQKVEFAREHDLPLPCDGSEAAGRAWDNGDAMAYFQRWRKFGEWLE